MAPSRLVVSSALMVLCAIWGSTWLVIRRGLEDLPPFTAAAVRFTVASLVMVLVAKPLHAKEGGAAPSFGLVATMGCLNFACSYGIVYWAETVIPSGLASVLWAVFPMMMAVLGHVFLPGEQLRRRHWAGFAVGFLGVALLFRTDLAIIGPAAIGVGLVYFVSPLVSAIGQTVIKRHGEHTSSVLLNRNAMFVGAVLLWAVALLFERDEPIAWTRFAIFSVAYLSIMGTVVTFGLYYWLLRYMAAHRLSLIAYVIPAIALFLGWAIGDEAVGLDTLGGTALILGGVAMIAQRRPAASQSSLE
ncbi:MAG: EamA family transporter [Planctomycetota bacterium]|nr:EamA family transporter [Planctomycetota bacterium]